MKFEKSSSKLAVIFGGEEMRATLLDGSVLLVRVRAMPVRHLGHILDLCTSEAELIEFVCLVSGTTDTEGGEFPGWSRVPEGWADNLAEASHDALIEIAKRLNFSRAENWGRRQIEAGKMKTALMTATDDMLMPVVQRMTSLLLSSLKPSGSPASPATPS